MILFAPVDNVYFNTQILMLVYILRALKYDDTIMYRLISLDRFSPITIMKISVIYVIFLLTLVGINNIFYAGPIEWKSC